MTSGVVEMTGGVVDNDKWFTLRDASKITGKSVNSLRLLINRKKLNKVKKIKENGFSYWMIHQDSFNQTCTLDMGDSQDNSPCLKPMSNEKNLDTIAIEYHDRKLKEWMQERDQLNAGLLMYRYKFEELEHRVKLLPLPVESVQARISELEAELQAIKKPWWKKVLGRK
jgi:hypothetical protein